MRKFITILILCVLTFSVFSQNRPKTRKQSIPNLETQVIEVKDAFIYEGDTIDFNSFGKSVNRVLIEDYYLKFYNNDSIIDSVYWDYSVTIDTFTIEGDSIKLKLSSGDVSYLNIISITSKLDTLTTGYGLTGKGTISSPVEVDSLLIKRNMKNIFEISLPASSTVNGRINGAIAGTDYELGWSLAAGINPIDLDVTHNMGRRLESATVWYNLSGAIYQQARNFYNAYTDLYSLSDNVVRIGGLYTGEVPIKIYLTFAE